MRRIRKSERREEGGAQVSVREREKLEFWIEEKKGNEEKGGQREGGVREWWKDEEAEGEHRDFHSLEQRIVAQYMKISPRPKLHKSRWADVSMFCIFGHVV